MDPDQIQTIKESICTRHIETLRRSYDSHNQLIEIRRQTNELSENHERLLQEIQLIIISREILADCIRHSLETQLQLVDANLTENQENYEQPDQNNLNEE